MYTATQQPATPVYFWISSEDIERAVRESWSSEELGIEPTVLEISIPQVIRQKPEPEA